MKLAIKTPFVLRVQQIPARFQYKTKCVKVLSNLKTNVPTVRGHLLTCYFSPPISCLPVHIVLHRCGDSLSDVGDAPPAPPPFVTRKQSLFKRRPPLVPQIPIQHMEIWQISL